MMTMKRSLLVGALAAALAACGTDVAYRPTPQLLPQNIQRLAIRPIVNKSQQFGLEDKLALRVRDEFLRDGRYPLSPDDATGAVAITITRYILTAVQYDATLAPTAYKLRILVDVQMVDVKANQTLWEERNLEGSLNYPASTLRGGLTEEQARERIWDILARAIVRRTVGGFGTVTGTSERRITGDAPSTAPVAKPEEPLKPVVNTPY